MVDDTHTALGAWGDPSSPVVPPSPAAPSGWTDEELGRILYLAVYADQGGRWEANESKSIWADKAREWIRPLLASPAAETAPDAGLVEALRPFAKAAADFPAGKPDAFSPGDELYPDEGTFRSWCGGRMTFGDLRKARAALSRAGERA